MNLNPASFLREMAARFPDKDALIFPVGRQHGKVIYDRKTFAQLERESDYAAYVLRGAGFTPGSKTIFMVKAGPELFTLVFACFKVGAIPVVVDPGMGIKRMLHCYRAVNADTFIGIPLATLVRKVMSGRFPTLKAAVTVFRGSIFNASHHVQHQDVSKPYPIYSETEDDLALVSFTTGSTGPAKAVDCTHRMASAMLDELVKYYRLTDADVQLLTLPFFGVLGMMMGSTCILPDMDPTKPASVDAKMLVDAIHDFGATFMFGSPALLNTLGNYAVTHNVMLDSLRAVGSGGAPMTPDIMTTMRKVIPRAAMFETTWGATEGLPLCSIAVDTLLGELRQDIESGKGTCVGQPVGRVKVRAIRIQSQDDAVQWHEDIQLPKGEIGELIVSGDNISPTYHDDANANRIHKIWDGTATWHRTGDLGWIDEQGRIWFCGRRGHRVQLRDPDETLYSVQIECIANAHPQVYRSALAAAEIKSEHVTVPVVLIELKPGVAPNERARIIADVQSLLANNELSKRIRHVLIHPSFPVDIRHNAKIERQALGAWATEALNNNTGVNAVFHFNPLMWVPIAGWLFIFAGLIWPFSHPLFLTLWWVDIFLSVVVHAAQIPMAQKIGRKAGFSAIESAIYTFVFGATWWRPLTKMSDTNKVTGSTREPG